jgi:hypothetical protein
MDAGGSASQAGVGACDPAEEFDRERFSLESFGDEEIQEDDDDAEDESRADDAIEISRVYSAQQQGPAFSVQQERPADAGLLGEHWLFAEAYSPLLPTGAAATAGEVGVVALAPPTLEALVERLTLPGRANDDTNDVCAAILLHPDLSKNPSVLSMYSKMNGGLRNYSTGTAHAWLYTPRKRTSKLNENDLGYVSDSLALVFVYSDDKGPAAGNDEGEAAKPKNKLHFGGRAYPLCNNSVLLQHGAHKPLG